MIAASGFLVVTLRAWASWPRRPNTPSTLASISAGGAANACSAASKSPCAIDKAVASLHRSA